MRLVANVAKHAIRVRHGNHLREACRFSRIFFVAAPAEIGNVGQFGHIGYGIIRVFGQWPVTSLAPHVRVLSAGMRLGFINVAGLALAAASIPNRAGGDHVERPRAVVPILAKVLGHDGGPDDQEDAHSR